MAAEPRFSEIRPRTRRLGQVLVHLRETASTQAEARARAAAGAEHGLVVVADTQTAGVGRKGNEWVSVGSSLHATILLRPTRPAGDLRILPLVAGLAATRAVWKLTRIPARLKWPNDIMHEDRKLGGILVDSVYGKSDVPDFMLVGIGLNGDARPEDFPAALRQTATSLSQAAGRHVCLPALLKIFLEELEGLFSRLEMGGAASLRDDVREALGTLGRRVRVQVGKTLTEGTAVELGIGGELAVETSDGRITVDSGECEELRESMAHPRDCPIIQ